MAKETESVRRLKELRELGKSAEDKKNLKMSQLFTEMQRKNNEKVSRSIAELKLVSQLSQKRDNRLAEIKKRLLNNLAKNAEERKKAAFERLIQNSQSLSQNEQTKRRLLSKIVDGLKRANRSKQVTALSTLTNNHRSQLASLKSRDAKLIPFFAQIVRKAVDRSQIALNKLRDNRLREMDRENLLKRHKQRLLNFLLRAEDKRRVALNHLRLTANQIAANERKRLDKIRSAIARIVAASRQKQERVVFLLTTLNSRLKFINDLEKLRESYAQAARERRKRGLLMLLVASQTGKITTCLNGLVRWANQCRISDAIKRDPESECLAATG